LTAESQPKSEERKRGVFAAIELFKPVGNVREGKK